MFALHQINRPDCKCSLCLSNPALIGGVSECAAIRLISYELELLRAALKKKHPKFHWVPWAVLLPQMKTSTALDMPQFGLGATSSSRPTETAREQQNLAFRALALAKRFLAELEQEGSVASRGEAGTLSARCLLQLLVAERKVRSDHECAPPHLLRASSTPPQHLRTSSSCASLSCPARIQSAIHRTPGVATLSLKEAHREQVRGCALAICASARGTSIVTHVFRASGQR